MKEYKDYQSKLKDVEKQENEGGEMAEQHIPAFFMLVFAFMTAGATYYLNEAGMRGSPFYEMTIGSEKAALLVTIVLEGSLLAIVLLGHRMLKSLPQRKASKTALPILEGILCINFITAFVMLNKGIETAILPAVKLYAQWGAPLAALASGIFWIYIAVHRRKTIMRNQMLDDAAESERLWAEQHRVDQKRYRDTYQNISDSPEMQEMREEIAVVQAIEQIARESQITFAEAEEIYYRIQERKHRQLGSGSGTGYQSANWRSNQPTRRP